MREVCGIERSHRKRESSGATSVLRAGSVLAFLFAVPRSVVATTKAKFGVRTRILSGWPSTPATAQSLEWLRDVDQDLAAEFLMNGLDDVTVQSSSIDQLLSRVGGRMHSSSARTFHELLVRNYYYAPRIETLRSIERRERKLFGSNCQEHAAWALLWPAGVAKPTAVCDASKFASELDRLASTSHADAGLSTNFTNTQLELRLRHAGSANVAVLYGSVSNEGVASLKRFLHHVKAIDAASTWQIVFRHADGPPSPNPDAAADAITGYGFELAIKSSEYKTGSDDEKDKQESSKGEEPGSNADTFEHQDGAFETDAEPVKRELNGPVELDGLLFHTLLDEYDSLNAHIWSFKDQLEAEKDTDAILKAWEIKEIGYQAVAKIKSSRTPLLQLMRLSQDFPAQVAGLARSSIPDSIRAGGNKLRRRIQEGVEGFSLNGLLVRPDHSELSLFPLVAKLQPFFVGVERMVRTGVSEVVACEMLKGSDGASAPERLNWVSPFLPSPAYHVSEDKKAKRWDANLQTMLMNFMGGLSPIRLPLYKVVFMLDPAEVADLSVAMTLMSQTPLPMSIHLVLGSDSGSTVSKANWDANLLGEAPGWLKDVGSTDENGEGTKELSISELIGAAHGLLLSGIQRTDSKENFPGSAKRAQSYLEQIFKYAKNQLGEKADGRLPDDDETRRVIKTKWLAELPSKVDKESTWEEMIQTALEPKYPLANLTKYVANLGVPIPSALVNGKLFTRTAFSVQNIFEAISMEQQVFQQAVYTRQLTRGGDVDKFIQSHGLSTAFHPDITPDLAAQGGEGTGVGKTSDPVYIQWPEKFISGLNFLQSVGKDEADGQQSRLHFLHVTVLTDLSQAFLLRVFAEHLLEPDRSSLPSKKGSDSLLFSTHWTALVEPYGPNSAGMVEFGACVSGVLSAEITTTRKLKILRFLGTAIQTVAASTAEPVLAAHVRAICELTLSRQVANDGQRQQITSNVEKQRASFVTAQGWETLPASAASAVANAAGAALWVCNGRQVVLDMATNGGTVSPRHITAFEMLEARYDLDPVKNDDDEPTSKLKSLTKWLNEDLGDSTEEISPTKHTLVASIRAEAVSTGGRERFSQPEKLFEQAPPAMRLHLPPARPNAASPIKVVGILDPLSETAQSVSAALALFGMAFNAEVNIVLNPILRHSEYPLKRYYREVIRWPSKLADGRAVADLEGGNGLVEGHAEFALATKHTLTAAVHALPTWMVTSHKAVHDMDNLRSVDVGDGKWCETTYLLRQLYTEGQAYIIGKDGWPRSAAKGLQVEVGMKGAGLHDDTLVMGNHGYFQFRGDPGVYEVALKSGVSNDTFEIATKTTLEVSSYITPPYQLRVRTRDGRTHEDLFDSEKGMLGDSQSESGIVSNLLGYFGVGLKRPQSTGKEIEVGEHLPTLHIFSVASGHLYEKLLSIMILSVRRQTKCPLHFWFIDNFLSPKFKAFIPKLAQKYNFGFDFVTYKWPSWLNPQSEKQRLIWAYKVLFLDVLFPQDVPKIIFIDADQVVRADIRELWDMDLEGKVYGWVPMGDSNPDTEGFKFWKQGYWKNHLGEKKYHIAALYVVDLIEFRRKSIGDQLRGVYNQLSRDPNSLSNLEQDLVNFAQPQVPIFSLPDEWLWCETWCSQESKPKAKTIDLCQNPLTKEPKIVMAKRIIKEWQGYHDDVQKFVDEVEAAGSDDAAAESGRKMEL